MTKRRHLSGVCTWMAYFIILTVGAGSCVSSKYGEKVEKEKNWVNWTIKFKPGTHRDSVTASLAVIDQFFADYIRKIDSEYNRILTIKISHTVDFNNAGNPPDIQIIIGLVWSQGTRDLKRPPRPPKDEFQHSPGLPVADIIDNLRGQPAGGLR